MIVNAAGPRSYLVADLAEETLPAAAIGHYYLTTRPDPNHSVDRLSPAVRNRHHRLYTRPESGGLIVGIYEAEPVEYDMEKLPKDFDMSAMKAGRDSMNVALLIHLAQQRFPWINERTPMTMTTGIMTFTPDGKGLCGALPEVPGLFHCSQSRVWKFHSLLTPRSALMLRRSDQAAGRAIQAAGCGALAQEQAERHADRRRAGPQPCLSRAAGLRLGRQPFGWGNALRQSGTAKPEARRHCRKLQACATSAGAGLFPFGVLPRVNST